jgi:steroid 5-alpha reductase family enzyme
VITVLRKIAFVKFLLVFFLNTVTGNYSQVDKLWSLMPGLYAWVMAYLSGFEPRQTLAASLITVWGARLTFNFARKGGYSWKFWSGEEDYRWEEVRKNPLFKSKIVWFLFNLFFISLYQTYLIMGFTVPIVLTFDSKAPPLGKWDLLATVLILGFWLFETIADE